MHASRRSAALVVVPVLVAMFANAPARALPPDDVTLGLYLTITAPETYTAGTPITVSGFLYAAVGLPIVFETAHGVPRRDVSIRVDGSEVALATTDDDGAYHAQLTFGAQPPVTRSIQSVALAGTLLETRSPTVTTRLARILIELEVAPRSVSLAPGAHTSLTALGTFDDGRREDVSARVSWVSSDATVATVDADGVVHGVGPGSATITATLDTLDAGATVDVG